MDYDKMSSKELSRCLHELMPDSYMPEIQDYNRETAIAFLKVFLNSVTGVLSDQARELVPSHR
jgi:hypothetical protein